MGRFDKLKEALGIKLDPEGYSDDQLLQQPIAGQEESGGLGTFDRASDNHLHKIPPGSMDVPDQGPSVFDKAGNAVGKAYDNAVYNVSTAFPHSPRMTPEEKEASEKAQWEEIVRRLGRS